MSTHVVAFPYKTEHFLHNIWVIKFGKGSLFNMSVHVSCKINPYIICTHERKLLTHLHPQFSSPNSSILMYKKWSSSSPIVSWHLLLTELILTFLDLVHDAGLILTTPGHRCGVVKGWETLGPAADKKKVDRFYHRNQTPEIYGKSMEILAIKFMAVFNPKSWYSDDEKRMD